MGTRTAAARLVLFSLATLLIGCRPSSEVVPPRPEVPVPAADVAPGHEVSFRIGHSSSSTSLYEQNAQAFLAPLAQRTDGAVHGQSFPAGQLAAQQEMVEQVQLGTLEMVIASCVSRAKTNSSFGRSRTPISDEVEQSFRLMPNTHFG